MKNNSLLTLSTTCAFFFASQAWAGIIDSIKQYNPSSELKAITQVGTGNSVTGSQALISGEGVNPGDETTLTVEQVGAYNNLKTTQTGRLITETVTQEGSSNEAKLALSDLSTATVNQTGSNNKLTFAGGYRDSGIIDTQSGNGNHATVTAGSDSAFDGATINQTGDKNAISAHLDGVRSDASLTQKGKENYIYYSDGGDGAYNQAAVTQTGNYNAANIVQVGSGNLTAPTTPDGQTTPGASILQKGSYNNARISQNSGDEATIIQQGSYDKAILTQSGSMDIGSITQNGSHDTASITESGNGEKATLIQNGSYLNDNIKVTSQNYKKPIMVVHTK